MPAEDCPSITSIVERAGRLRSAAREPQLTPQGKMLSFPSLGEVTEWSIVLVSKTKERDFRRTARRAKRERATECIEVQ